MEIFRSILLYGIIPAIIGGIVVGIIFKLDLNKAAAKRPIEKDGTLIYRQSNFLITLMAIGAFFFTAATTWSTIDGEFGPSVAFLFFAILSGVIAYDCYTYRFEITGDRITVRTWNKDLSFTLEDVAKIGSSAAWGGIEFYLKDGQRALFKYDARGAKVFYDWIEPRLPEHLVEDLIKAKRKGRYLKSKNEET